MTMYNPMTVDVALFLLRVMLGTFFVLARFRWVYDPGQSGYVRDVNTREPLRIDDHSGTRWFNEYRRMHLQWKIFHCGYGTHPIIAAAVATVEIVGGLAFIFGCLTQLAALGLVIVTLFATICTAREKTAKQSPVDNVDWVSCYLWLPEPHLLLGSFVILLVGPGVISLDAVLVYVIGAWS